MRDGTTVALTAYDHFRLLTLIGFAAECAAVQCILVEHIFDLDASRNHSATLGITSSASNDGYDARDSANGAWSADVPN